MIAILVNMPTQVKCQTVKNKDGLYSVFLNARMASNQIKQTYQYEIGHIEHEDFEKKQVQKIEHAHMAKENI